MKNTAGFNAPIYTTTTSFSENKLSFNEIKRNATKEVL